ncbi:tRNA uridine-5-carboxymethylaminomethyl(34) synthesis GTPase MnmE [Acuticoccus sp. I52.16.1]|uniref:tRNA uridine-5-carboxymethylaminomethyl(34) synthesis GTPase MnmE n=1 Tax=Acuticoccus sp. I52.16.1 TaxID=2928472 RepID=UPI001FD4DE0C|nr:tRNA uridine-5-carboxymethylaminomethyl(34) synthesis GTPase MnmE [Acuticoccus sp. I52.16.1]UOM36469.1 tRNA uridine-5-carboxymethylaminomethyl(34) synthesis GTPase MnmE [Acuticoccus sp. I52.16.1]
MHLSGTIVALSSGRPPSAIAIVRASGPDAPALAAAFGTGALPPRRAVLRTLRSPVDGAIVDRALCLAFPAPDTATGEEIVEFHCHGGPAVVERVLADAVRVPGVRMAEPGEFTLRAVLNGRMGIADAEALADVIEARTESERRRAVRLAEGALSRLIAEWRSEVIALLADAEARLDFADEGDVSDDLTDLAVRCAALGDRVDAVLTASTDAEKLTDGFHVVLVGPPNAGKSSLLNALTSSDAAIVTPEAGTTRDVLSVTIELAGYRVTLQDTAGLREGASGVEAIGIERTRSRIAAADLVVAVVSPDTQPLDIPADLTVSHKADMAAGAPPAESALATSVHDPSSIAHLKSELASIVTTAMQPSEAALITRARQRAALTAFTGHLRDASTETALELQAEALRLACHDMARMTGEIGIEDVLDDVFGRFCIGK